MKMNKTIEEILPAKPEVRLRIYAYSIGSKDHAGLLKIGQSIRDIKQRVLDQTQTVGIKATIEVDESAEKKDGGFFSDKAVRDRLNEKGFESVKPNPKAGREWVRCTSKDVRAAINELREGRQIFGNRDQDFPMRAEQSAAVEKTFEYFSSIWAEKKRLAPRFLWNAKMRFGKTFTAYQLAKKMEAKRVLVVTFKPAVEDAWKTDLVSHVDFEGWQYMSRNSGSDPTSVRRKKQLCILVHFRIY